MMEKERERACQVGGGQGDTGRATAASLGGTGGLKDRPRMGGVFLRQS